jgi:3-isopropylmalate dehydratase small subunit
MKRAIPVDVYDKEGNMLRIEFNDMNGDHIIDAQWDPTDEQTSENREAFRKWAYNFVRNKDYEVLK